MFFKALTVLLTIGASLALVPEQPRVHADRTMLDFMIQSRAVGDPATQQRCFGIYLPSLKAIADQYETDYNRCVAVYETEIKEIEAGYTKAYENIIKTAQGTCSALKNCTSFSRYGDAFDCYALASSEQSKVLFSLSGVATDNASTIKVEYFKSDSDSGACVKKAENDYWKNTAQTQDELQKCLEK